MQELLTEAIRPINLPFTILVGLVLIYWLLVAAGVLGMDVEGDAGAEAAGDGEADAGPLTSALQFLNAGDVPLTLVLSVLAICVWILSLVTNYYWTGSSVLFGLAALVPILLVSACFTRLITTPLKLLTRSLEHEGDEHQPLIGRTCRVSTSEATSDFGQAQVERKGSPLLINVRTLRDEKMSAGAVGLIVQEDRAKGLFFITPVSDDALT